MPAPQPVPMTFGIHLMEPLLAAKRRKKAQLWPTATDAKTQAQSLRLNLPRI